MKDKKFKEDYQKKIKENLFRKINVYKKQVKGKKGRLLKNRKI